ncbi:MAG: hypothetical protein RJB01_1815 [Actinomycetota bacterium]
MNQQFDPTPRPALRKAADADVHPITAHVADDSDTGELKERRKGKSLKAKRGKSSSDTLRVAKSKKHRDEKPVAVTITVTKAQRKELKREAKARGISIEQLVAERIN